MDPTYASLLKSGNRKSLALREKAIAPVFSTIAVAYADLHDRTGRMSAVGAIREAVPWVNARRYFYNRLHRRLVEQSCLDEIRASLPVYTDLQARELLENVIGCGLDDAEDRAMAKLLIDKIKALEHVLDKEQSKARVDQILQLSADLDEKTRLQLVGHLQR